MKNITLFVILILTGISTYSQNLIGYTGKEIQKYMKENCKNMNISTVNNSKFKYLKYSDSSDSQTMLFFLNQDSVCKSVRFICDLSTITEKKKEFDSIYKKRGENRWVDNRDSNYYLIEIKDEEWSFVVTIEPDK